MTSCLEDRYGRSDDSDRISLRIQAEWITDFGLETTYEDCVRDFLGLGMPATLRILSERLGRPRRCVAVEDSPFGVIAARAAGMSALGYAAAGNGERLGT